MIEESAFERLGGVKRITVDARIVTATNKDLPVLIREGKFREDLFFRINVVSFHLPPLRGHREDIPLLVEHFLAKYSERYVREPVTLDPATMAALCAYDWPGNVRELENVVNRIVLLGEASFTARRRASCRASFPPRPVARKRSSHRPPFPSRRDLMKRPPATNGASFRKPSGETAETNRRQRWTWTSRAGPWP